jgi:hypothetical protein
LSPSRFLLGQTTVGMKLLNALITFIRQTFALGMKVDSVGLSAIGCNVNHGNQSVHNVANQL